MIDLRSDTVTKPTPEMRRAMMDAEVGDDVYGEDPTVNLLEARAAQIMGKEASLFVPTGTMGNTIGLKLHTEHGQEVICESRSHILNYELSMLAWFAGCLARPVTGADGILNWDDIRAEIRPLGPHRAPTGLIEVENTANLAGGTVYPLDTLAAIYRGAHSMGLNVHMDGARIFNAAAALDVSVSNIAANADTVMFCLSKGLGAPAGSMLAGPRELIDKGRLLRKRLGGGMRQAGVLAAAGLIALEQMPERLPADHDNAKLLAEGLARIDGIEIDTSKVRTNILFIDVSGTGVAAAEISSRAKRRGLLFNAVDSSRMRLVTHYDAGRRDCEMAIEIVKESVRREDN
jgi:threonine aldolase